MVRRHWSNAQLFLADRSWSTVNGQHLMVKDQSQIITCSMIGYSLANQWQLLANCFDKLIYKQTAEQRIWKSLRTLHSIDWKNMCLMFLCCDFDVRVCFFRAVHVLHLLVNILLACISLSNVFNVHLLFKGLTYMILIRSWCAFYVFIILRVSFAMRGYFFCASTL